MGDGISFRMVTGPFNEFLADRQRRMPRAAMYAVREAGRVTRRAAAAKAPVLKNKNTLSHAQLQRFSRAGVDVSGYYISGHDENGRTLTAGTSAIPGLLKASIHSSKRLKRLGTSEFSVKVGPRGARVHLYAAKQESRYGYMQAGENAGRLALGRIAKQAFEKVWRGR